MSEHVLATSRVHAQAREPEARRELMPVQRRLAIGTGPRASRGEGPSPSSAVPIQMFADAVSAGVHQRVVQLDGDGGGLSSDDVHRAAAHGMSGSGGSLPHLAAIQQSFGRHDVSGVSAHVGGRAAEGSAAMGARAYASGNAVAFASSPDLHLAAHEAAHVVQQRGGVQLSGGVGASGDTYEQHADAVADLVTRGESAEALLDQHAPSSASSATVQRAVQRDLDPEAERYLSSTTIPFDAPRDWMPLASVGAAPPPQPQQVTIPRVTAHELGPIPSGDAHMATERERVGTLPMGGEAIPVFGEEHTSVVAVDPGVSAEFRSGRMIAFNEVVGTTERLWNQVAPLVCAAADAASDPTLRDGAHDGFSGGSGTLDETAMAQTVSSPGSSSTTMGELFPHGATSATVSRREREGIRHSSRSGDVETASTGAYVRDAGVEHARTGIHLAQGQLVQATDALATAEAARNAGVAGRRLDAAGAAVARIEGERTEMTHLIDEIFGIARRIGTAAATGGGAEIASAARESAVDSISERTSIGGVIAWAAYREELQSANARLTRASRRAVSATETAEDRGVTTARDGVRNAITGTIQALEAYNIARLEQRGAYDALGTEVGAHSGLSGRDRGRVEAAIRAIPRVESVAERYASIAELCAQVPHATLQSGEGFALAYASPWVMGGGLSFLDCIRGLVQWRTEYAGLRDQWQHRLASLRQTRELARP